MSEKSLDIVKMDHVSVSLLKTKDQRYGMDDL